MVYFYLHQGLQILLFLRFLTEKLEYNFYLFYKIVFLNQETPQLSAITAILGEAYKLIIFLLSVSLQSPRVNVTHLFSGRADV